MTHELPPSIRSIKPGHGIPYPVKTVRIVRRADKEILNRIYRLTWYWPPRRVMCTNTLLGLKKQTRRKTNDLK